ncbi:hypothetical protein C0J08_10795 [Marinomonas sp. CT5]|uniref:DUF6942 family protein n=1 Tax=Marinomonas sp. CT5 TaxID=2066133 RepID=UPI001BAFE0F5|nr:hypothetical protein [Marinomonas sp. CT5]QUX95876.1 hypothetical protein C0J08_10795 [Marinomonas sp. CT5]
MNELWLGANADQAEYIFVLPNKPILPSNYDSAFLKQPNVFSLVELNGNHWRKILTIMAKLTVPNYPSWKAFRDADLFKSVGVVFSEEQIKEYSGVVFIVGNRFRDVCPVFSSAKVVGEKHVAHACLPFIWCPYLDYRQFPNVLIEALREHILEKECLKL